MATAAEIAQTNGNSDTLEHDATLRIEAELRERRANAIHTQEEIRKLEARLSRRQSLKTGEMPLPEMDDDPRMRAAENGTGSVPTGDINFLIERVPAATSPFSDVIARTILELVEEAGGAIPSIQTYMVIDSDQKDSPRLVVRWEPELLPMEHVYQIYYAAAWSYEKTIRGHTRTGGWERVVPYYALDGKSVGNRRAIYFGTHTANSQYFDNRVMGVFLSRQFKSATHAKYCIQQNKEDWMSCPADGVKNPRYAIEIREGDLALPHDRMIHLALQISVILKRRKLMPRQVAMTGIYRKLNRIGVAPIEKDQLYGMKETLTHIERALIVPLRHPERAAAYRFGPKSVLLAGVMGVGKTLLTRYLLQKEDGALFVPLDPATLRRELLTDKLTGTLLQVDRIKAETYLPLILLIDDIDQVVCGNEGILLKVLTFLQGVRQKGFYILATTNFPEKIDPRLLQPGRLSPIIHVPLPGYNDRKGVLRTYLEKSLFKNEEDKHALAEEFGRLTEGWTQRYLEDLCDAARRICFEESMASGHAFSASEPVLPLTRSHMRAGYDFVATQFSTASVQDWDENIRKFILHEKYTYGGGQYI